MFIDNDIITDREMSQSSFVYILHEYVLYIVHKTVYVPTLLLYVCLLYHIIIFDYCININIAICDFKMTIFSYVN